MALGGPKQRALLAILLLHRGEVVSPDRLIDELWGEQPPASATKIVQGYVSNLRKALGDGLLVTRGAAMCCSPSRASSTWTGSRRWSPRAGGRSSRATPRTAAAVCGRRWGCGGVRRWRTSPMSRSRRAEIARLEESRLAALEDRIDADLALGEHARLVGELEALVARASAARAPAAAS